VRLSIVPGFLLAAAFAAIATGLAPYAPILGAPVIAIVLGVGVRNALRLPQVFADGIAFCARDVLQLAIIVSGFGISLVTIARTGLGTLPVTFVTIAIALVLAPLVGKLLKVEETARELIGIGTAICGASAIAAVSTVVGATEAESALAISTIFFHNILAVLTFPVLGHAMAMTQSQFGVWAGTAINDTSSVVAAGFAYGREAGTEATIVKLTRATLILPIVGILAIVRARRAAGAGKPVPWKRIIPWFILWFLVAALVNSTGVVPQSMHLGISAVATFLISMALAAIGLQTSVRALVKTGARPLVLGFVIWVAVAVSSLAIQRMTGV
jgi:uncharacterized integral membrane protein (TIGR00698 family)